MKDKPLLDDITKQDPAKWLQRMHEKLKREELGATPFDADYKLAIVAAVQNVASALEAVAAALSEGGKR